MFVEGGLLPSVGIRGKVVDQIWKTYIKVL